MGIGPLVLEFGGRPTRVARPRTLCVRVGVAGAGRTRVGFRVGGRIRGTRRRRSRRGVGRCWEGVFLSGARRGVRAGQRLSGENLRIRSGLSGRHFIARRDGNLKQIYAYG